MSSKFDETINQFKVGNYVRKKGREQVMKITSNIPGGGISIEHYLKTDRFVCEWMDENGVEHSETFYGSDLESAG
jgi:hypothetical protein